jgi:hypothetical protein
MKKTPAIVGLVGALAFLAPIVYHAPPSSAPPAQPGTR